MDLCTPEHLQSKGMVEHMMTNLVKVIHVAVTEGRYPSDLLTSFLREYRATPQISTEKSRSELLMGRTISVSSLKVGVLKNYMEKITLLFCCNISCETSHSCLS